ncbi:MAG TPA: VOC family protein [Plantibacter sp.]|uniref:VOC family protein n=1 Tax=unclassified Plantibacter TaxID=2624265 RepID=UPI002BD11A06|nr:VOC family protein [Plantibacter sp.]
MSEPRTYPSGVTSWIDLESSELDAAMSFYGALFGWTFEQATPPTAPLRYVIAKLDGSDVAGFGETAPGGAPSAWNTYVAVDDIEAACAAVELAGGTVVDPPTPAGEGGLGAVCQDPEGVGFRLWQAKRRLGAQAVNVPGGWNFSNLHTADQAGSQEFYGRVFPWRFTDMGFATVIQVPGYGEHLAATSDPDIFQRQADVAPEGFVDVIGDIGEAGDDTPRWEVVFAIADRDQTSDLARSLGAEVLGTSDNRWTKDVTLSDPQGAVFTASQFAPSDR